MEEVPLKKKNMTFDELLEFELKGQSE